MSGIWVLIGVFALLSIILLLGKGSWLIAGYNTSSRAEKEKYDKKKLCKTVGMMLSAITVALSIFALVNREEFAGILIAFIIVSIIIAGFYANTKCYRK